MLVLRACTKVLQLPMVMPLAPLGTTFPSSGTPRRGHISLLTKELIILYDSGIVSTLLVVLLYTGLQLVIKTWSTQPAAKGIQQVGAAINCVAQQVLDCSLSVLQPLHTELSGLSHD